MYDHPFYHEGSFHTCQCIFQNQDTFKSIGNSLEKDMDTVDPNNNFFSARICVEVDLEVGLLAEIKLTLNGLSHM